MGVHMGSHVLVAWQCWSYEIFLALDLATDAYLAVVVVGGLSSAIEQDFKAVGELVKAARRRQVLTILTEAADALTGPSVTLAALMQGRDPAQLLELATKRFRCVSWVTLRSHSYLITGGGALDGTTARTSLYKLSEPCKLAECDAFLSHSWHDHGVQKWEALEDWCETFSAVNGRGPRLWFDKLCVDQSNIEDDLACLPIFLAGCNSLLVTCGRTYTTRLWCCVELFVYMTIARSIEHDIHVCSIGDSPEENEEIAHSWANFDVKQCQCFKEEDKERMLMCIEKQHGAEGFNTFIRNLATTLFLAKVRPSHEETIRPSSHDDMTITAPSEPFEEQASVESLVSI